MLTQTLTTDCHQILRFRINSPRIFTTCSLPGRVLRGRQDTEGAENTRLARAPADSCRCTAGATGVYVTEGTSLFIGCVSETWKSPLQC